MVESNGDAGSEHGDKYDSKYDSGLATGIHESKDNEHVDVDINMYDIDKMISESMKADKGNKIEEERQNSITHIEPPELSTNANPSEKGESNPPTQNTHNDDNQEPVVTSEALETEFNYSKRHLETEDQNDNNKKARIGSHDERQHNEEQDLSAQNLEREFEKAIEDHHREMSEGPQDTNISGYGNNKENDTNKLSTETQTPETNTSEIETLKERDSIQINEKEDLNLIAKELENATTSTKEKEENAISEEQGSKSPETVYHDGISVPANSELLNTNTAFAAYNALSSQLPPLAVLANAHLAALPLPIVAPDYLPPRIQLLVNTLPTLDNLATQLLRIVAIGPYQKIVDLASNPDSPAGATYRDMTSLFEFTKRLYSEEDPFLTVEHLAPGMWKEGDKTPSMFRNREQSIESTLRKVNLATFLAATLGTIEVGFFYLNESFLDVFCPANNLDPANALSNMNSSNMSLQSGINTTIGEKVGKLLKPQAVLYLDLKTQAYISAIEAGERSREEILEDILPANLGEILLSRRGAKFLSPTELDFIDRCASRKETLLKYPDSKNLSDEYEWFSFLKDLFDYVAKNMGFLIWGKKGRSTKKVGKKEIAETSTPHSQEILNTTVSSSQHSAVPTETPDLRSQEISDITSALLPSEIQEQQLHLRINPGSTVRNLQRRPWTREEEKALRHALELKGPSWSTILELFGNGGKISEALKNRSQVQLKDKARNWKMFFLKSGLPVPNYLQKVTGDLERDDRSRANKRANRNRKTAAAPVPNPTQKK